VDIDEAGVQATAERARAVGVDVDAQRLDVADRTALQSWAAHVADRFGGTDVLINNAGVSLSASVETMRDEDFEWLFGIHRPPTTLDPAQPAAFDLVADLVGQLAPLLPDRAFHLGLDEPWELTAERRPEWVGWLERLRALPALAGRELLVWGDVPGAEPALLDRFPEGVTVCEWGYEDNHPFDDRATALRARGVPFWLAPGTSSWLSVSGRVDNMLGNITAAANAAVRHGAAGLLVTDWGDMGHHQYLPVSEPGLAVAAACSWGAARHRTLDPDELAGLLDAFVFDDPAGELGAALVALGRVHRLVAPRPFNLSPLVQHLLLPQWRVGTGFTTGLTVDDLDTVRAALAGAVAGVDRARPQRPDGVLVADELRAAAALLDLACRDAVARLEGDGSLASIEPAERGRLADDLDARIADHRRLWLARNRPGGLDDSVAWWTHLRDAYRSGVTDRSWFGPLG